MRVASARRYLAIWLPRLPTDRLRRENGPWSALPADAPLVVADRQGGALRLVAVDDAAFTLALVPGLTLADARARVPHIAVATADPVADARLLDRLTGWSGRYTPLAARDGEDGIMLDITGCTGLFGGEAALMEALCRQLAASGLCVQGAIAGTPGAASAFARFAPAIVPAGGEADHAAPLPVAALELGEKDAAALRRAGLKDIGALIARPRAVLAARFGAALLDRLERVTGAVDTPISPLRPVPLFMAERAFAEPLSLMEDVLGVIEALAGEISRRLEERGQGGRAFTASLFRTDAAVRHVDVTTATPMRGARPIARLFAERLAALAEPVEAGFGFDLIRLGATCSEDSTPRQGDLAGAREQSGQDELAALVDRLGARLGEARVRRFHFADTHIPERRARTLPACRAGSAADGPDTPRPGEPPARPLSLFDPPRPIAVMAALPDGPPLRFRWRRALHEVVSAEGPERIAAEWWHGGEVPLTRDYYRLEDASGCRFWVFREGLYERETTRARWYLHGLFA